MRAGPASSVTRSGRRGIQVTVSGPARALKFQSLAKRSTVSGGRLGLHWVIDVDMTYRDRPLLNPSWNLYYLWVIYTRPPGVGSLNSERLSKKPKLWTPPLQPPQGEFLTNSSMGKQRGERGQSEHGGFLAACKISTMRVDSALRPTLP